jgi:transcriptional regulator GlxA family with amidase domain
MFPETSVQENVRWVDAGRIVTSGGISAGIDMSLYLVSRLEAAELAAKTARQMEFYSMNQNPPVAEDTVHRQRETRLRHVPPSVLPGFGG